MRIMRKTLKKRSRKTLRHTNSVNKRRKRGGTKRSREEDDDYSQDNQELKKTRSDSPYILSVEGGEIFRKVIVVDLSNYPDLMNGGNMAYYVSSGKSNSGFTGAYANTWLPFGGKLDISETGNYKDKSRGHFIKMSDFSELKTLKPSSDLFEWEYNLLKTYYLTAYLPTNYPINVEDTNLVTQNTIITKFFNVLFNIDVVPCTQHRINLTNFLREVPSIDILDKIISCHTDYKEVFTFLHSYFLFEWQVYLSETLDGLDSYWTRNPLFKEFILTSKINNNFNFSVELPSNELWENQEEELKNKSIESNDDDVINFLKSQNANYSEEYMNPMSPLINFFKSKLNMLKCTYQITVAEPSLNQQRRVFNAMLKYANKY